MAGPALSVAYDMRDVNSRRRRILVVEDNPLNMKLFTAVIQSQGYDVIGAEDGAQALALARNADPDLVIMDIQLPDISGLELTRMLKDDPATSWIPVIATSAFAKLGAETSLRESGCDGYMAKPIAIGPFLELIDKMLARTPFQQSPAVPETVVDGGASTLKLRR